VIVGGLLVCAGDGSAWAQSSTGSGATRTAQQDAAETAQLKQSRYKINQVERALEGAVEHGATLVREKVQAALRAQSSVPDNMENAHVRGFRLDGYGVFFDIEVPALQGTFMMVLRQLDQNDLGLNSAINLVKSYVDQQGNTDLQQALRRIELQVAPNVATASTAAAPPDARKLAGTPAAVAESMTTPTDTPPAADPVLADPEEAYRSEVKNQIMDAMLDYSGPLSIGANEWLTIAARRRDERPLLAPADTDARTVIFRINGTDLAQFRGGQLPKADALKRIEVRVF
jgi:hypothetical protein